MLVEKVVLPGTLGVDVTQEVMLPRLSTTETATIKYLAGGIRIVLHKHCEARVDFVDRDNAHCLQQVREGSVICGDLVERLLKQVTMSVDLFGGGVLLPRFLDVATQMSGRTRATHRKA